MGNTLPAKYFSKWKNSSFIKIKLKWQFSHSQIYNAYHKSSACASIGHRIYGTPKWFLLKHLWRASLNPQQSPSHHNSPTPLQIYSSDGWSSSQNCYSDFKFYLLSESDWWQPPFMQQVPPQKVLPVNLHNYYYLWAFVSASSVLVFLIFW